MGDLSEHFSRWEFACGCGCGDDGVSADLIEGLESTREVVKRPIRVTSGRRCEAHNTQVSGSKGSQHMLGRAADVTIDGVRPKAVAWIAETLGCFSGIKAYAGGWTHLDIREGARFRKGF